MSVLATVDDENIRSATEPVLRIHLLGLPEVFWEDQALSLVRRQARALLYRLAASPHPLARDELCFLFWPDIGETAARRQLTVLINHLRRELPSPHLVKATDQAVELHRTLTDALAFDEAATVALRGHSLDVLIGAIDLYRGSFLHGFSLPASAEFEVWATQQRRFYERRWLDLLTASVEACISAGDYPAAMRYAERHLATDERDEAMHHRLMWLHAASGDTAAALRQFDACADVLERDLNLSPSPATWALFEATRAGTFNARDTAHGVGVTPAHTRREFRPAPIAPLPVPPNPLLGRELEIDQGCGWIRDSSVRLLTLTGPGGSGKTRLALHMAAEMCNHFAHGVVFVSLASITDPRLVIDAIARDCGLLETSQNAPADALKSYLRDKHMLLVLDNFEHVLPAAVDVASLLAYAPRVQALVTSRSALHVSGEHVLAVPPLPLPDLAHLPEIDALAEQPAVALLLARARAHDSTFQITANDAADVAAICVRLDGLPLAIELAAARLKVLSPAALRARLADSFALLSTGPSDLPERQQTLRATIEWSYQLLQPEHQRLFEHLAAFSGGWTLGAIEAIQAVVTAEAARKQQALDSLTVLIDNSLVMRDVTSGPDGETRFTMLETIREFARDRLARNGDAGAVQLAHAVHFMGLAQQADLRRLRPERMAWFGRVERDHDNLCAALRWSLEHDAEIAIQLAASLWPMWHTRGQLATGRDWLMQAIVAVERAGVTSAALAQAHFGAGLMALSHGDYVAAQTHAQIGLAHFRAHDGGEGGPGGVDCLNLLGEIAAAQGDLPRAVVLHQQCLELSEAMGDAQRTAYALSELGSEAIARGEYASSTAFYERCYNVLQQLGDKGGMAMALYQLGDVAHHECNLALAAHRFTRSLELFQAVHNRRTSTWILNKLGEVALYRNQPDRAILLFEECLALSREMGFRKGIALAQHNLAFEAVQAGDLERAEMLNRDSLTTFEEAGIQWGVGLALGLRGVIAQAHGDERTALREQMRCLDLWRATGTKRGEVVTLNRMGELAVARGDCGEAERLHRQALALAHGEHDRYGAVVSLEGLVAAMVEQVCAPCDAIEQIARWLGAAEAAREKLQTPARRLERVRLDRVIARIRAQLDDAAFFASWSEGRATMLAQASADALDMLALEKSVDA